MMLRRESLGIRRVLRGKGESRIGFERKEIGSCELALGIFIG